MRLRPHGLLVLLLLSFSLSAQNIRDAVTIEVVDVPVFVTRGTEPVQGLTRDDFELYVNGKPQPIDYFDVVGAAEAGGAPEDLRERRLFVLMIDLAFTRPHVVGHAQRAAAELVARAPKSDLFAIATFSQRRGVWFSTPFTSDRVALARGIASLSASASGDPLAIVLTPSERMALNAWSLDAPERSDYFLRDDVLAQLTNAALRDIWSMQIRRAVEHQLLDFRDLATRLATLQGQKHVVVLSEGYEIASGASAGAGNIMRTSFAVNDQTGYARTSPGISLIGGSTFRHLDDMRKAFQASDILLHTLDLRGVATLFGSGSLRVLPNETGGRAMYNRNDLGEALVALSDSYSSGYLLGFKPLGAQRGHNKIVVKVKGLDRGTKVFHRKGFSSTPRAFDPDEGLYLADVILNDVPQTGTAAALAINDGRLHVRIPLRPLAAQLGTDGQAELLVYVFGDDGIALDFHRRVVDVPAESTGETTFDINLPPGAKVAKALLRVDESIGFSRTQ